MPKKVERQYKRVKKIRKKLDALMLKDMGIKTDTNLKGLRKNPICLDATTIKEIH